MKQQRDQLVDVLKGIGIISVVIGHGGTLLPGMESIPSVVFVYLYHLMVFFFAAGIVFHPEKHPDPYEQIGKTIGSLVPLYVGYNFCFLLLHNFIIEAHLMDGAKFSSVQILLNGLRIVTLKYTEPIVGALWFVPMFLLGKSIFFVAFHRAEQCRYKWLAHAVVILTMGGLGLFTNTWQMYLDYNLQTALLGIPLLYIGYLFNRFRNKMSFTKSPVTLVISFLLICFFISQNIGYIELSQNYIISPALFFPVTLLGMVFCVSLGEQILKCKRLSAAVSYIGTISFHIMAIHFLVFKLFDWIYGHMAGVDISQMMVFPTAYTNIGLIYSVIGIAGSVALYRCYIEAKIWIKRRMQHNAVSTEQ